MATFGGLILTNNGRNLFAKAQTGKLLKFKKIILGDGELGSSESIVDMKNLKNKILECNITKLQVLQNAIATITFELSNQNIETGFYWRELGVIAEDPDTKEEILYLYGNAGETGEYISGKGSADILEKYINIDLVVTNIENITAVFDDSLIYITEKEFDEKVSIHIKQAQEKLLDNMGKRAVIKTTAEIPENTDYEIPLNYKVGNNSLEVYYMEDKLVKTEGDIEGHYNEVGEAGSISNKIQFDRWGQAVPAGRMIEFIVRGDYSNDTNEGNE